jgi:hypothetical protein
MRKNNTYHRDTEAQRKATEESKSFSVPRDLLRGMFPLCLCVSVVDFSVEA